MGIKYAGAALKPATRYYWRVTVTDEKKKEIDSPVSWFETGLLGSQWDNAQWISSPRTQVSPYRSDFVLSVPSVPCIRHPRHFGMPDNP